MKRANYIGVDVGGTKMSFGYIKDGKVVKQFKSSTDANGCKEDIIEILKNGIHQLIDESVEGIGIGVPGLVDVEKGVVYNVQNIPAWKNVALKDILSDFFNLPVFIGNDANCFLLGEKYFGKGKQYANLVALAMGTGTGAGVLVNSRLHIGNLSMAGEFGGIRYKESNYEDYCSGKFFNRTYGSSAEVLAQKADKGDEESLQAFSCFGEHVAHLLETIIYAYGPEAIIFGGSVSKAYPYFETQMRKELQKFPHQNALNTMVIVPSENDDIPVLGAAALVPYNLGNELR